MRALGPKGFFIRIPRIRLANFDENPMTVDQFNSLAASNARPFAVALLSVAVFVCCFIPATADVALGIAGAAIMGYGAARSFEKVKGAVDGKPQGTQQ